MPKISIILPVYNGSRYLAKSIDSIIKQNFTDWELIIVDDCSKDQTPGIIKHYTKLDNRIKSIRNQNNLKLPASLNEGFKLAKGKYWTWTSDDNIYLPSALKVMADYLDNNQDVGLVYTDMTLIDGTDNIICSVQTDEPEYIMLGNVVGASFLYRKDAAIETGEYDNKYFLSEDFEYFLRMSCKHKFQRLNQNLYLKRHHDKNLSVSRRKEVREIQYEVVKKYLKIIDIPTNKARAKLYVRIWTYKWWHPEHILYFIKALRYDCLYSVAFPFKWLCRKVFLYFKRLQFSFLR